MHAVVLSFPGHFFQTQLCVKSLLVHYPEINRLSFVLDDVQADPWDTYPDDFAEQISRLVPVPWQTLSVCSLPKIGSCVAGWWRQQLIKLTLDQILPDDEWFVVDGDVIFYGRCDVRARVPISKRHDPEARWSKMCINYVRDVLGTYQGELQESGRSVITSAIPFRYLSRSLLQDLRLHVESRFQGDFVDMHLAWFQDQTIVADIDPPTRWVMSEWELIECFRRYVQGKILPFEDLGSGYQIGALDPTQGHIPGIFLHSYQRDAGIQPSWFAERGLDIKPNTWHKSLEWYDQREIRRLV